jgi:hypothetical protein
MYLLEVDYDIGTIQVMLGHKDLNNTILGCAEGIFRIRGLSSFP